MNATSEHDFELGDDLEITQITPREVGGGAWVRGTIHGHRFEALVFADHPQCQEWELDGSRVSKLWLRRQADQQTVYHWDRGLDVPAADDTAAAIVGFLAAGLAEHVHG